jgi:hypothetical protein
MKIGNWDSIHHRKGMLFFIAPILAILITPLASSAQILTTEENYVYLDQNYNVVRRLKLGAQGQGATSAVLTDEQKKPKTVLLFELPESSSFLTPTTQLKSQFISVSDGHRVTGPHGRYLIPVFEDNAEEFSALGSPVARLLAYRLIGRDSWYLEESKEGYGGVFFKIIPDIPLYKDKAQRAIEMTDYLFSVNDDLPANIKDAALPEFLQLSIKAKPFRPAHIVIYRSAEVIHHPPNGGEVVPMHGFLGCETCVQQMAQAQNVSVKTWKKNNLLPLLAEFTATSQLWWGALFAAHTQNLLMEVEPSSGRILKIYPRDLGDILINPLVRLASDKTGLDIDWEKARFLNISYAHWSEPQKNFFAEMGYYTAIYTTQTVDSHLKKYSDRLEFNEWFIEEYRQRMEATVGFPIVLSSESRKVMDSIRNVISLSKSKKNLLHRSALIYQKEVRDGTPHRIALASVFEDIYTQAIGHFTKEHIFAKIYFPIDQIDLANIFKRALGSNRVGFATKGAKNRLLPTIQQTWLGGKIASFVNFSPLIKLNSDALLFGIHNGEVVATDKLTGEVLAATFTLNSSKTKQTAPTLPSLCKNIFLKGGI